MFRFEHIHVWKRSIVYADQLMDLADSFPQHYQFSLGEQLRRAGLSIGANIAEGSGRGKGRDAARFYRVARGSVYEVVSLVEIARRRDFLDQERFRSLYAEANEILQAI